VPKITCQSPLLKQHSHQAAAGWRKIKTSFLALLDTTHTPSCPHKPKMALPTLAEFLDALEHMMPGTYDDCSICSESPMNTPVRLPCDHIFCKKCITQWLIQPYVYTCPLCRQCLYQPITDDASVNLFDNLRRQTATEARVAEIRANTERMPRVTGAARAWFTVCQEVIENAEATRNAERLRAEERLQAERLRARTQNWQVVNSAFDAAGLSGRNAQTRFRADVLNLNRSVSWSEGRIEKLRRDALLMLVHNDLPRLSLGAIYIDAESLGTSLILMSNALMHLARLLFRPWSDATQETWRQMVMIIWQLVAPEAGHLVDRQMLYLAIMSTLIEQCAFAGEQDNTPSTFFRQDDLFRDLQFMVNFLIDHAGPSLSSDRVREGLAAHCIEQPHTYTSWVSTRAERMASTLTSMTFADA
jgi:hypothetical protein